MQSIGLRFWHTDIRQEPRAVPHYWTEPTQLSSAYVLYAILGDISAICDLLDRPPVHYSCAVDHQNPQLSQASF